jgi:hypothetical protein
MWLLLMKATARDSGHGARLGGTGGRLRAQWSVHIEPSRENVFTVTATGQELSALVAGARMALEDNALRARTATARGC